MNPTYLSEVLYGNYPTYSEDRLSQIFSATFNHSAEFRRTVATFLTTNPLKNATASTQVFYPVGQEGAQIDILLSSRKKARIVIENKIDAQLTHGQLKKYDRISDLNHCNKYCFVKHYQKIARFPTWWNILYWGDFYVSLKAQKNLDFLSHNFINILEEYGMDRPEKIAKNDIQTLASALYQIRYKDKPNFAYSDPIFENLVILKKFMEDTFRRASKEPILLKRAGKAFRAKFRVSWWYEEKKKGKEWLWIGCEVTLRKQYNNIDAFGAALLLYDKQKKYKLLAYVNRKDKEDWEEEHYRRREINCSEFENMAIKFWIKKLK
jgi:hypothetical protein